MKPSERINALAAELLAETERSASPKNFIRYEREYRESALLRAIVRYLDELLEALDDAKGLEGRRVALWSALANIGPGCFAEQINPFLERAGVAYRAENGEIFEDIRSQILRSAREAGLL